PSGIQPQVVKVAEREALPARPLLLDCGAQLPQMRGHPMTAPIIIATPHGIEAVEAVVQYGHSHDDARALREFMPSKFDPVGPLINYGEPFPPGTIVHFVDALGDEWHGRGGGVRRDGSGQEWDTP